MCTLSDIFPSTHAIKPLSSFTPAQCNYQSFSGARAWHLPAEGTFPLPFWRQPSRGAGQSLSAAASIASPGLWHVWRWLGTRLGTPMHLEGVQSACVLQKLHLLGHARANAAPQPRTCPAHKFHRRQHRRKPFASPPDTSLLRPRYGAMACHGS